MTHKKPTPDMVAFQLMKRFGPADLYPDTLSVLQAVFFSDILYLLTRGKSMLEDRLIRTAFGPIHSSLSTSHATASRLWSDIEFDTEYTQNQIDEVFSKDDKVFVNSIARTVLEGDDAGKVRGHILKIKCVREALMMATIAKDDIIRDLQGDDAVSRVAANLNLEWVNLEH